MTETSPINDGPGSDEGSQPGFFFGMVFCGKFSQRGDFWGVQVRKKTHHLLGKIEIESYKVWTKKIKKNSSCLFCWQLFA